MATSVTRRQVREAAAADLGLFRPFAATTVDSTNHTVIIPEIVNAYPDPFLVRDAFITSREALATGNTFYRIVQYATPETPSTLQLASGPDFVTDNDVGIYFLLTVSEWNDCYKEALSDMWKRIDVPFSLVENDNDYPVDEMTDDDGDLCTYVTIRGLIETLWIKHVIQTTLINKIEWSGYFPFESSNSVVIHFTYLPWNSDQISCVLVVNKPYSYPGNEPDSDDDTTTCPFKLAQLATEVKALKLAFIKYGTEAMRPRFAAQLAIKEQQLAAMKLQWMPPLRANDFTIDESYAPDIPDIMREPTW